MRETFHKSERLCSRKIITGLFEESESFYSTFFKVAWKMSAKEFSGPARVAFVIPKRSFRHAVSRNLLKRRLREAYRKNKQLLYSFLETENIQVAFVIIFKETFIPDYQSIESSITGLFKKFIIEIREKRKRKS